MNNVDTNGIRNLVEKLLEVNELSSGIECR